MSDFAHIFAQIIQRLGGRDAVQSLLGVGPSALSNYLRRAELPHDKVTIIKKALRAEGWSFDPEKLHLNPLTSQTKKQVLLIITGGIAAYKGLDLARRLMDRGFSVRGVMTKSAQEFITPLSLSALTKDRVYTELFSLTDEAEMGHIRLARDTDLVLIAPATANFIAKLSHGLADCLASTLCLATDAPIMLAPAMNPNMWQHPATQDNLACLEKRGVKIIAPVTGDTACGEIGTGRLAEPVDIADAADQFLCRTRGCLAGWHVLITSGPTHEPIDPVRYIGNKSSGKQGHALAAACAAQGARVTLVSGPVNLPCPANVTLVNVNTAREMHQACLNCLPADIAICAAAVADWYVVNAATQKQKKQNFTHPQIELAENPDILASLSQAGRRPKLVIGFSAETDHLINNSKNKLVKKKCDWIIANHISDDPTLSVFGSDQNKATLLKGPDIIDWPYQSKQALAEKLILEIDHWIKAHDHSTKTK
jgi:phosphopantothenoylcysteine decarboxylase/phosphopantothenate--cysteine ligase